jgi:hypothetical protein
MTHDDALLEQISVLALGALPAAEASQLRAHIAGCAQCRKEFTALRATADLVGFAAEMPPLDELTERRMKSRVMHAVRASAAADEPPAPLVPAHAASVALHALPPPPPAQPPWLAYGVAAAALIAAVFLGANDFTLRSQVDAEHARTLAVEHRLGDLFASDSEHFPVEGGEVIRRGGRLYVAMHRMPPLASGRVFQVWTLKKGAKAVEPSVTFTPDAGGGAVVELPISASDVAAVAVSQEPPGGSTAPTTTPAFVRKLS